MNEKKKAFLEKVLQIWEQQPDLRFGQLLCNATSGIAQDLYFASDEELLKLVEDLPNRR